MCQERRKQKGSLIRGSHVWISLLELDSSGCRWGEALSIHLSARSRIGLREGKKRCRGKIGTVASCIARSALLKRLIPRSL